MRKSYQHAGPWSLLIASFLLVFSIPFKSLSQQPRRPCPYRILAKSIKKYDRAHNGHYIIQRASTSIYVADTTKSIVEGYYSFSEVAAMGYPLIQQTTTDLTSGIWLLEKTRNDTVHVLGTRSEKWDYYTMTYQDRADFLLTNHGLIPFTHPGYFVKQLFPVLFYAKQESALDWIIQSGPYKIWIGKADTLIHRIDYRGSKRHKYYRRIDILQQDFDRPEYDDPDLYRYNPAELSRIDVSRGDASLPIYVDPIQPGTPLALPPLPSTQGDTVSLSDFEGKVLLLDFWYIGCKPCVEKLPALQQLHEKYKDQGLVVIGLEVLKNDPEQINRFVEGWGVDYLQLYGYQIRETGILNQFVGYPTIFLVDQKGSFIEIIKGANSIRISENRIVELLEAEP